MSTILAALDSTAAARPVLETALRFAEMTGADVEAVHVADGPGDTPETLARRSAVPLRVLEGPADAALLRAISEPTVTGAVIGARATTGGRRPVGHTTLRVIEGATKPVVVVPPEAVAPSVVRRALVPLEGTEATSQAVSDTLLRWLGHQVDLMVLHVFTDATLPRMLDRPVRDMDVLAKEFLVDHLPFATSIEMHIGPVSPRIIEATNGSDFDVVVLSWSQDTSGEHAHVVREVLAASAIPVVLLPLSVAVDAIRDARPTEIDTLLELDRLPPVTLDTDLSA